MPALGRLNARPFFCGPSHEGLPHRLFPCGSPLDPTTVISFRVNTNAIPQKNHSEKKSYLERQTGFCSLSASDYLWVCHVTRLTGAATCIQFGESLFGSLLAFIRVEDIRSGLPISVGFFPDHNVFAIVMHLFVVFVLVSQRISPNLVGQVSG